MEDDHLTPDRVLERLRSANTGLALWWAEHPEVPRATVVGVAVDVLVGGLGLAKMRDAAN